VMPTKFVLVGLVNGDTSAVISGTPVYSTNVTSSTPVGVYELTSALGTLTAANYYFYMIPGTVQVYAAHLTLSANGVTMTQGSPVPPLTYTLTGFVNGDTSSIVTGAPVLTTTATSSSPPGIYPITVSRGTLAAPNYVVEINYEGGYVTITP
jgi:type IV secretory pathway protease TraF